MFSSSIFCDPYGLHAYLSDCAELGQGDCSLARRCRAKGDFTHGAELSGDPEDRAACRFGE